MALQHVKVSALHVHIVYLQVYKCMYMDTWMTLLDAYESIELHTKTHMYFYVNLMCTPLYIYTYLICGDCTHFYASLQTNMHFMPVYSSVYIVVHILNSACNVYTIQTSTYT